MICLGVKDAVISEVDGWTAKTADGKLSAQWEHQILVTNNGYEILTQ
jgi:methionyl aminopeptidase